VQTLFVHIHIGAAGEMKNAKHHISTGYKFYVDLYTPQGFAFIIYIYTMDIVSEKPNQIGLISLTNTVLFAPCKRYKMSRTRQMSKYLELFPESGENCLLAYF